MQTTASETIGYHRRADTNGWSPAAFRFDQQRFSIRPEASAGESAPEVTWDLNEVATVMESAPASNGMMTIEIAFVGGTSVLAALSTAFVADLCAQLAETTAKSAPPPPTGVEGLDVPPTATISTAADPPAAPVAGSREPTAAGSRRSVVVGAVVGMLLVLGLLAALAYSWNRASDESARADAAAAELADVTAELDTTAADLESTRQERDQLRTDLDAATAQVEDLTTRVSELSNEKAAVQDERNAAQELNRLGADAASKMADCRDRVLSALDYTLDELYYSASAVLEAAVPICNDADAAIAAFADAL